MVKLWMLAATPICAVFWALGGADGHTKGWRKVGVGLILSLLAYAISRNWIVLLIFPLFPIAERGYGIPDSTDEGSSIGRFWFDRVKDLGENRFNMSVQTHLYTNFLTRASVALFYSLAIFPLVVIGSWIYGLFLIMINTIFWNVYAPQKRIKSFTLAEIMTGAGIGLGAFLAIL